MSLTADLQAIKALFGEVERDPEVRAKPRVGPKLVTGFQPFHLGRTWVPEVSDYELLREAGWFKGIAPGGPQPEAPEAPEALGSSMARNSHRPRRHGFGGLPPSGRTNVSEALALLEERRPLLSFWTVTLPTEALREIAWRDCWPRFVDRLLQRPRRKLTRALGHALYVGVVELQGKRTRAAGMPCPHLHVVFQGRRHTKGVWLVKKGELDAMIKGALKEVEIEIQDELTSAGNVQQVRKSVRAYLAKYMTKGSTDAEVWKGGLWQGLIPRQWWMWSEACRELVESCRSPLPTGFMAWVWRHRIRLLEEGWFYLQQCEVPTEAPATYRIFWNKTAHLAALIAQWHEYLVDAQWKAMQEIGIHRVMGEWVYAKPLLFV